jgi:hypothetical protein
MRQIKRSSSALRAAETTAARPCGKGKPGKGNHVEGVSDALLGATQKEVGTGKNREVGRMKKKPERTLSEL